MAVNCSINTLAANSKCYLDQCSSDAEREALEIYFRVQGLIGAGGTTYSTVASLLSAAKTWQSQSEKQLQAIDTFLSHENAVANGASLSTSINALKGASKCYLCIPKETRLQVLMFLRCALSNLGKPD